MRTTKISVDLAQWMARSAFEEGFRAAGGNKGLSQTNHEKGKWFDHWLNSKTRAMLIANGVISGEDNWR